jgi:S-formylglutathione hydrolase FrmB
VEPDSTALVVVLLLAAAGLIAVAIRYRPLAAKIVAGLFAIVLSAASGIVVVNIYYGYYQTWSQLSADFSGSYSQFASAHTSTRGSGRVTSGRLKDIVLPGPSSGISRHALVYLPHQYFEQRYAQTRFPVVELLHGSPGNPGNWAVQLNIASVMDQLMAKNLLGPMILVMPAIDAGNQFQDCVDAPGRLDDTYISRDVPQDIRARFRASLVPAEWGIGGFSSGGYCAANLALRHPAAFGAAGVIDGYFRPADGPAGAALHFDAQAEARNNPLVLAANLRRGVGPMPSLWVLAGTGGSKYDRGARAFVAAVRGAEPVTFVKEPGSGHNFYRWRPAVPRMLAWMWGQLAPPALRVQFPVAGSVNSSTITAPVRPKSSPSGGPGSARSGASRSGSASS